MPIDMETLIGGGGSGFVAAILTALGINTRLKKLEETKLDCKVYEESHDATLKTLDRIERKLDKWEDRFLNGKG